MCVLSIHESHWSLINHCLSQEIFSTGNACRRRMYNRCLMNFTAFPAAFYCAVQWQLCPVQLLVAFLVVFTVVCAKSYHILDSYAACLSWIWTIIQNCMQSNWFLRHHTIQQALKNNISRFSNPNKVFFYWTDMTTSWTDIMNLRRTL